ncbi:SDR family oxidoreductase [Rhizobium lusitanum]|uniref:SDR family oxidoreductase n=1 Tax=Rhizobium lusitanum TaxID=293958 RepID=UPI001FEEA6A5|nr:SDR family NAD(P)-dependent oxidoreductase [Rhizobium lusitanum]
MSINGKIALITDASSGVGVLAALDLAAGGVKVGITARRTQRLAVLKDKIERKGGQTLALEIDVAELRSVEAGVKTLLDTYGSIDILFNNAGIMPVSLVENRKADEWNRMVDVKGVLNTAAAVLPHMIKQHSGHILNTSSFAGRTVFACKSASSTTSASRASSRVGLQKSRLSRQPVQIAGRCWMPTVHRSASWKPVTSLRPPSSQRRCLHMSMSPSSSPAHRAGLTLARQCLNLLRSVE